MGPLAASERAGHWPRLKVCLNPAGGRAFYDRSRNRSGRWCSMATCGNRQKGRSYRRRRAAGLAAQGLPEPAEERGPDATDAHAAVAAG